MHHKLNIPTEILLKFGKQLDGPSFPICESTILSAPFNNKDEELKATKIVLSLRHTRHFEWKDIRVSHCLKKGARDPNGTQLLVNQVPFPILPPILCWMPSLTQLSLILPHSKPSDALLLSILDPVNLQNLKTLVLDFPSKYPKMSIERLYPLFCKLDELRIQGAWYCGPNPDSDSDVDPDAVTVLVEALDGNSMKLKRLVVDWVLDSFFKKCLNLEHLTIKHPMFVSNRDESPQRQRELCTLFRQIPKLRTIILRHKTIVQVDEFSIGSSGGAHSPWRKMWGGHFGGADWTLESIVDRLLW
ncbi:hypothetical protein BGX24_002994 [Mortierella sp. AD032]|nr:hypothetical protein BGX24_002994 [Mortierella sp. AD032]